MAILTATTIAQAKTPPPTTPATKPADPEAKTFLFVVSWIVLIVLLSFANQTRIGHVIIYYSLMLMILLILVSEYKQFLPYMNFQTIGQATP